MYSLSDSLCSFSFPFLDFGGIECDCDKSVGRGRGYRRVRCSKLGSDVEETVLGEPGSKILPALMSSSTLSKKMGVKKTYGPLGFLTSLKR